MTIKYLVWKQALPLHQFSVFIVSETVLVAFRSLSNHSDVDSTMASNRPLACPALLTAEETVSRILIKCFQVYHHCFMVTLSTDRQLKLSFNSFPHRKIT